VRRLPLLLILGCISVSVMASPVFTDQGTEAGYLNPADVAIPVQTIHVSGDSTYNATVNAVQVRNYNGTAGYQQITRIEVRNGGGAICAVDDPSGLTTVNGVTMSSTHTITKGDTEDLVVLVWIGDTDAVQGGETVHLDVRFYYLLNGTAGTSPWISDGKPEETRKAGFEVATDTSPDANNFNPSDEDTVQVVSFQDTDANESGLTLNKITVKNTGTATADDIASLKVTIAYSGGPWEETKTTGLTTWKDGGIVFDPPDITIADGGAVAVTVIVKVADPTPTVPVDNRTIRTQATLEVVENAQTFNQVAPTSTTQKIRRGGVEEIEDDSTVPASGVLNSGETLVQKIIVRDRDVNGDRVNITRIWVKNLGNAQASEIQEIRVKSSGASLGTFSGNDIADFLTGVWLDIADVPEALVANQGDRIFIIEYVTASSHTLRPQVKVEGNEAGNIYTSLPADYPEPITLHLAGFEIVENQALNTQTVYSGLRFCAQKILLEDIDENSKSVTINPVVVRNRGTATDAEITKIEIRTASGDLLGDTEVVGGLSAGGVTLSTLRNNVVADNGEVTLWIWVTLAGPEHTVAGHSLQLETTIFHAEDATSYQRTAEGTSFTLAINHRPTPDFSYSPTIGNVGKATTFTAQVTDSDEDDIASYEWTFGEHEAEASSEQNPTHAFASGGTFDVTLTATDSKGLTGTKTKTVTVNQPPVVGFTWDPEVPDVDADVAFTSTVTDPDDPDDTPFTYAWTFGDTATSDKANPTHAFAEMKAYDVTLSVTDYRGGVTTVTHTVTVGNKPPVVDFTWVPTAPDIDETLTFTATVSDPDDPDDTPFTYAWDFGDDGTSTAVSPTHSFAEKKNYTVTLVVTDARRGKTTVSKTISVGNEPPVAIFTVNKTTVTTGEQVEFTDASTDSDGTVTEWAWDFGDHTPIATNTSLKHTYVAAGTYTVSLVVTDDKGTSSTAATTAIIVAGPPQIVTHSYPNPASTQASIVYYLPTGATDPVLRIYNITGALVFEHDLTAGESPYVWNLTSTGGTDQPNGLYLCIVVAKDNGSTIKSPTFKLLIAR